MHSSAIEFARMVVKELFRPLSSQMVELSEMMGATFKNVFRAIANENFPRERNKF